jgi:hypothetical protein
LYYLYGGSFYELKFEIAIVLCYNILVDAYYVPCSCLLVLIKHVYEGVYGGTCVLVGVTGGEYYGDDNPRVSLGCLPYFVASLGIKKIPCYGYLWCDLTKYP